MRFHILEIAKRPGVKVGAHDRALLKHHSLPTAPLALLDLLLWHVTQRRLVVRNLNRELEARFQVRLVETGKRPSRIAGLELGGEHAVVLPIAGHRLGWLNGRLVLGTVEACHAAVHDALKPDCQGCLL